MIDDSDVLKGGSKINYALCTMHVSVVILEVVLLILVVAEATPCELVLGWY